MGRPNLGWPIEDYGVLADGRTAALVSPAGSIDWLCWPHLDSPSIFGRLLDPTGGHFTVRPLTGPATRADLRWDGPGLVLRTHWHNAGTSVATVTDLLAHDPTSPDALPGQTLLRRIDAHDDCTIELVVSPAPAYGTAAAELTFDDDRLWFDGPSPTERATTPPRLGSDAHLDSRIVVHAPGAQWQVDADNSSRATARLELPRGTQVTVTMSTDRPPADRDTLIADTMRAWDDWSRSISHAGPWRATVRRSAAALKSLAHDHSGAVAAALTTSLPEHLGGERNWDYRFTWNRDAAWILEALLTVGSTLETERYLNWFAGHLTHIGGLKELRPIHGLDGEFITHETTLDHWDGYGDSQPVRVGNLAADQQQNDIIGAFVELVWQSHLAGIPISDELYGHVADAPDIVAARWQEPDQGIWEFRSEPLHHVFSKFQCWLAVSRAADLAQATGREAPTADWQTLADEIHADVMANGVDPETGAFRLAYNVDAMDAANLLLIRKGFIAPDHPSARATVLAVRSRLEIAEGLVLRYAIPDALEGHEGAFFLCSWWLAEALALIGDVDEAEHLMDRLIDLGGPLGLFAEEYHPEIGRHLGNYPQGYSHCGLITAAHVVAAARDERNE